MGRARRFRGERTDGPFRDLAIFGRIQRIDRSAHQRDCGRGNDTTRGLSSLGVGFHLPVKELVIFGWVAIAAGIAAAVFPARRAARLNVPEALQYE
jgi:ABC-type antimicrobial peptide transport system permease subunit